MPHEAMLYEKLNENKVRCNLCAHRCTLSPDMFGICGVRQNLDGTLYTSGVSTEDANPSKRITLDYDSDTNHGVMQMAFVMVINKTMTAQEQTDLKAYLVSKFSGWTP